jgi:hypothetical protein
VLVLKVDGDTPFYIFFYHATTILHFCTFCCVNMHCKSIVFATTIFATVSYYFSTKSADLHRNSLWRTSPDFFCSDATLVQKNCSDVSGEVSGKITSPDFFC